MLRRQSALAVLLVASMVLAGCGAVSDGGGAGTTQGPGPTETIDANATAVKQRAVDAMRSADTYSVTANVTREQTFNARTLTIQVNSTGVVDRSDREMRLAKTVSRKRLSQSLTTYLTDGTLYQHSAAYERQYGSAWVKRDLGENVSALWDAYDPLRRQRYLLQNASVEITGTTTVDGTEVYVLAVDGNESAYEQVIEDRLGQVGADANVTVEDISFTYYVSVETGRPLLSEGTVNSTMTAQGSTLTLHETLHIEFGDYGDTVDVTLPEGAETAVSLDNRTGG